MDLPESSNRTRRYILSVHDGKNLFMCRPKTSTGPWRLICSQLFPVQVHAEKTRLKTARDLLNNATYGSGSLWISDWSLKAHHNVFGLEGTLLELEVSSEILEKLLKVTTATEEHIRPFLAETFQSRLHAVKAMHVQDTLSKMSKQVCPEGLHCMRYLALTFNKDGA
jgi:hypothetical protein